MPLALHERQRHNATDVHLRPENMHRQAQLLSDRFDILEAFLVVGASTAYPDGDFVLFEDGGDFAQSADHAFEGGCDLGGMLAGH